MISRKIGIAGLLLYSSGLVGQNSVRMAQFDVGRTAAFVNETTLTLKNVNSRDFGRVFSRSVDASQFAQPLVEAGLTIGGIQRNVLYVATMANTVYAFDADDPAASAPLWSRNLGQPMASEPWTGPLTWGILSTPFIDRATNSIYVVAKVDNGGDAGLYIHALDLITGQPKFQSGARMKFPHAGGTFTNGRDIIQRTGLLVSAGVLYIGVANVVLDPANPLTQEGYVQAFDATNLSTRLGSLQITPGGLKGGVWQAGRGIAADGGGSIFVVTGGGSYDGLSNFGSSILRLTPGSLAVQDWFTPANHETLFHGNLDPGANGLMILPGTDFVVMGGKNGKIYLIQRSAMGRLEGSGAPVQQFQATQGCGMTDCAQTPGTAFWRNTLYIWDARDRLRAYSFNGSRFNTTPSSVSSMTAGMTGGPSVSGSGTSNGIVWAVTTPNTLPGVLSAGTLRAFNASNLGQELYNSNKESARDELGTFAKMSAPVIANGKVYVGTMDNRVQVYGLLPKRKR